MKDAQRREKSLYAAGAVSISPRAADDPMQLPRFPDIDSPLQRQEGGSHYKDLPIQPVEFIHANAIGYFEGNVIKYVSRWRNKNGIADLEKAKHYIDLLIELERK
jgi:Protein of unknwon function (DUF3310)